MIINLRRHFWPVSLQCKRRRQHFPWVGVALLFGWMSLAWAGPHPFHDDQGAVQWRPNLAAAMQEASLSGKPIFLEATREGQANCVNYARTTFPNSEVKRLLRRFFVCVSLDRDALPPRYDQYIKSRSISSVPVSLFLTPQGDVIFARQDDPGPADVIPILKKVLNDPRLAMQAGKQKDAARQVELLRQGLVKKDTQKVQAAWGTLRQISGMGPSKWTAAELLDQAEEPARRKMDEAANLVRQGKFTLARLALEEAQQRGEYLPVASEIRQILETIPLLESAANQIKTRDENWKTNAANSYQQILQKYPDTMLATWTLMRLKELIKQKG